MFGSTRRPSRRHLLRARQEDNKKRKNAGSTYSRHLSNMKATSVMATSLSASAAPATNDDSLGCASCGRGILESDASCIYCGNTVNASLTKQESKRETPDLASLNRLWVPDDFSNHCMDCKVTFGFFKSRHHCRVCGLLFCRECVKNKMVIPSSFGYTGAQSCCRGCVTALQHKIITSPADIFAQRRGRHKESFAGKKSQCECVAMPSGTSLETALEDPGQFDKRADAYGTHEASLLVKIAHSGHVESQAYVSSLEFDHHQHPRHPSLSGEPHKDVATVTIAAVAPVASTAKTPLAAAKIMLDCIKCSRRVADSDQFCVYCGTKVAVTLAQFNLRAEMEVFAGTVVATAIPASAAPAMECGCVKCGRTVSESDALCVYCGTTANASPAKQESKREMPDLASLDKLWVPDDFSNHCMDCKATFGFFKSRHHCRVCGLLFCRACAKNKMVIPPSFGYTGAQSCCRGCVTALQHKIITSPADIFAQRRGRHKKSLDDEEIH